MKQNENICVSFIDILVQKGFQIKGKAAIIEKTDLEFIEMEKVVTKMTEEKFPFTSITKISIEQVKPIIAPSYILYSETTEKEQIKNSKNTYGL